MSTRTRVTRSTKSATESKKDQGKRSDLTTASKVGSPKSARGRRYFFDVSDVLTSSDENDENEPNTANRQLSRNNQSRKHVDTCLSQVLSHLSVSDNSSKTPRSPRHSPRTRRSPLAQSRSQNSVEDDSFEFPLYGSPTKPEEHELLYASSASKIDQLHDAFSQISMRVTKPDISIEVGLVKGSGQKLPNFESCLDCSDADLSGVFSMDLSKETMFDDDDDDTIASSQPSLVTTPFSRSKRC